MLETVREVDDGEAVDAGHVGGEFIVRERVAIVDGNVGYGVNGVDGGGVNDRYGVEVDMMNVMVRDISCLSGVTHCLADSLRSGGVVMARVTLPRSIKIWSWKFVQLFLTLVMVRSNRLLWASMLAGAWEGSEI